MKLKLAHRLFLACLVTGLIPIAIGLLLQAGTRDTSFGLSPLGAALAGGGVLLAAGLVSWQLQRELTQSIRQMRQTVQAFPQDLPPTTPASALPDEYNLLIDEVRARLAELSTLRETTADLATQLDVPQLLQTIAERASRLMGVSSGAIYETDLPQRRLRLVARVGAWVDPLGAEMDFGEGAAGRAASSGESQLVNDYPHWPGRSPRFAGRSLFNVLSVPMRWRGQLIGVLSLEDQLGSRSFGGHDLALAEQFAHQAATAIGNARLFAAASREVARLGVLHQASQTVSLSLDPESVYQATYAAAGQLVPTDAFVIALLEADDQPPRTVFLMDGGRRLENVDVPVGSSLTAHILHTRQPLLLRHLEQAPFNLVRFDTARPVQSLMAVPMQVGEQVLGMLSVQAYQPEAYTEQDVLLLTLLSNQAAAALQNARSFQAAQRRLAELELLQEVAQAAVQASNLDRVISHAMTVLHRKAGYDVLAIYLRGPDEHILHLHPCYADMVPHLPSLPQVALGQGITGQVAATGRARRLATVDNAPDYVAVVPATRAELCVPLKMGEHVIGVLDAEAFTAGAFSAEDERLLTVMAGLLAPIIERMRLAESDRIQVGQLSLLYEIARAAVAAPDFDTLVEHSTQTLSRQLGHAIVGVALLDETGEWLQMHASFLGLPQNPTAFPPLHASQGLAGTAVATRHPVRVGDVRQDRRYWQGVPDVLSELVVPLQVGDRVIGVLDVESRQPNAFSDQDEQLLVVVAGLLAPLMLNARLRATAEQHAHELDVLYQAQLTSTSGVNPQEVLKAITHQVGQGLEIAHVFLVEWDGENAVTAAQYHAPGLPTRLFNLPADVFPSAWAGLRQGAVVYLSREDDSLLESERAYLRFQEAHAVLAVPLQHQDRFLGYLSLWEDRRPRVFSEQEHHLAQALAGHAAVALDNASLYQAAQRRAEQMRLVNEVSRAIVGLLDVDEVLEKVSQSLETTFHYYHVAIGWCDGSTLVFRERFNRQRGVTIPGVRVPMDGPGIIAWVARNRRPKLVPDVSLEPQFMPHPYFPQTRAQLTVPLISHGKLVGVLDVQSDLLNGLSREDQLALEAVSGQLAVAIENAQLYAEARQRADEVSALLATTVNLTSSMNLKRRLDAIAQFARRLVDGDSCLIFKLETGSEQLRPLVVHDRYAEQIQDFSLRLGEGITGYVAMSGKGELVNRLELDPRAKQIPGTPLTPESLIAVPLKVGDRITGVMSVYREGMREFTPHDFNLIASFAAQAATAIENAQLYEALQERANSLQAAYDELAEIDRLKDEVVQNVSHELRTPLTFLQSYVDLLLGGQLGPLQPEQEKSLRVVAEKTQTLIRLVNDIFTLQVVSSDTLRRESVDMAALARQAAEGVVAAAQQAGLHLETEIPHEPVWVNGSAPYLAQVLDNLLSNAVKFTEPGGKIWLGISQVTGGVRVEVRDTGIGIATDNLKRVFDRFYQVDGSRARRRGGLGLGLAICKRIVESHGGILYVESHRGQGSTFHFILPTGPSGQ